MADEVVMNFLPGDPVQWEIEVQSRPRVRGVWAIFFGEAGEMGTPRIVLSGRVLDFDRTGEGPNRVNRAVLVVEKDQSDPMWQGDYRLNSMTCITHAGNRVQVPLGSVPDMILRVEGEPANEVAVLRDSRWLEA